MIFLPNKFERFLGILRNRIYLKAQTGLLRDKDIENLRKITSAEAIFYKDFKEPVDIKELLFSLFCSSLPLLLSQNKNPYFKIDISSNFLLNKKLFAVLFLTILKTAKSIEIKTHKAKILISAESINLKELKKLISALEGTYLYHNKKIIIIVPADKTDKKSTDIKKEWVTLDNPFSLVNIFMKDQRFRLI